jgi:hypothetical protein
MGAVEGRNDRVQLVSVRATNRKRDKRENETKNSTDSHSRRSAFNPGRCSAGARGEAGCAAAGGPAPRTRHATKTHAGKPGTETGRSSEDDRQNEVHASRQGRRFRRAFDAGKQKGAQDANDGEDQGLPRRASQRRQGHRPTPHYESRFEIRPRKILKSLFERKGLYEKTSYLYLLLYGICSSYALRRHFIIGRASSLVAV